MKKIFLIFSLFVYFVIAQEISLSKSGGQWVDDPIKDYLLAFNDEGVKNTTLYSMRVDIDGDQKPELLLSLDAQYGAHYRNWQVFEIKKDKFKAIGLVSLPDKVYLGKIKELNNRFGLLTSDPEGESESPFSAFYIENSEIKQAGLQKVNPKYWTKNKKLTHESIEVNPLIEKYKPQVPVIKVRESKHGVETD